MLTFLRQTTRTLVNYAYIPYNKKMLTGKELGKRIRVAREEADLTQGQLGKLWGERSHAAVSDVERGSTKVGATDLSQLAKIFDKPVSYFYGEDYQSATFYRGARNEDGTISNDSRKTRDDFIAYLRSQNKNSEEK